MNRLLRALVTPHFKLFTGSGFTTDIREFGFKLNSQNLQLNKFQNWFATNFIKASCTQMKFSDIILTQMRDPFLAASWTVSQIPSYGHTVTFVSLMSSELSKLRCLETALSIFDTSMNKLQTCQQEVKAIII